MPEQDGFARSAVGGVGLSVRVGLGGGRSWEYGRKVCGTGR